MLSSGRSVIPEVCLQKKYKSRYLLIDCLYNQEGQNSGASIVMGGVCAPHEGITYF